jgi:hypothetical protein
MNFRLVGSMLLLACLALQSKTPETQIKVISDVEYCTGGGQPLVMDVFIPKNRIRIPIAAAPSVAFATKCFRFITLSCSATASNGQYRKTAMAHLFLAGCFRFGKEFGDSALLEFRSGFR